MHWRLVDIYDRLFRADQHLDAIKELLLSYYGSGLGGVPGEYDPERKPSLVIQPDAVSLPIPSPRLHTFVGEFLHNVHSALEHIVWQLVQDNGGTPTEETCFPILRVRPTANKKEIHPPPYVAGNVSAGALALIEDAQPYHWGDKYAEHPLWVLHQLWSIDKHRHVAAKGSRVDEFLIPPGTPKCTFTMQPGVFDEDGTELLFVPDDPAMQMDARTTLRIIVHEPGVGVELPLWATLKDVRMAVLTLVVQAERDYFAPSE